MTHNDGPAGESRDLPRGVKRWLGPWRLDTWTSRWEHRWVRPFEHVNIPARVATYLYEGPVAGGET